MCLFVLSQEDHEKSEGQRWNQSHKTQMGCDHRYGSEKGKRKTKDLIGLCLEIYLYQSDLSCLIFILCYIFYIFVKCA